MFSVTVFLLFLKIKVSEDDVINESVILPNSTVINFFIFWPPEISS